MIRNAVLVGLILLSLAACNTTTPKVENNTFSLMPDTNVVISDDYTYLGSMRVYVGIYRTGQNMPRGQRPMDNDIFICDESPRRLVVVSRWTTGRGGWSLPRGGNYTIDGVKFSGSIWKEAVPDDELLLYLVEKGYDYHDIKFYKLRLTKAVSRSEAYNIFHYVEKNEMDSDDWTVIKPYVSDYVNRSMSVVGE